MQEDWSSDPRCTRSHVDGSKYGSITWHTLLGTSSSSECCEMLPDAAISWLLDHYWLQTGSRVTRSTREKERQHQHLFSSSQHQNMFHKSKLLPKMFYSWAKSWELTMNMREWWNEKTKNINRNSMEHQYNIIHKPKTIKKLDCFTSSMKTIAHHHHSHFTTQTHSFKWHFKRSHEST